MGSQGDIQNFQIAVGGVEIVEPQGYSRVYTLGRNVLRCHFAVCHAVVACSAVSVWGLDSSCVEQSVGDSLSVATAPGSV